MGLAYNETTGILSISGGTTPGVYLSGSTGLAKYQTKVLGADVTATDTDFLTFNNLTIGRTYRFFGTVLAQSSNADGVDVGVLVRHNAVNVRKLYVLSDDAGAGNIQITASVSFDYTFVAAATTVTLRTANISAGDQITALRDSVQASWATLEDLSDLYTSTTAWT